MVSPGTYLSRYTMFVPVFSRIPYTGLIHGSGVETGCYPFTDRDPFILNETPHVYFIGNQPKFESRLVTDEEGEGEGSKKCRIVLVPKFCETGQVVLVHSKSLETKVVGFEC